MVLLVVVGIAGLSVVGWVVSTAASAPALNTLKERDPGSNTEVLAADGTRLGFISADELSRPVSGDRLPQVLKDATVAIEDERFYKHQGVDYEGIVRAAVKNFMSRETVEGGSTLTMQLVKNLYTADRTREGLAGYQRKIREAKLDLHEAALLAGLPQAPSAYSPIQHGKAAKRRRNAVLGKMAELGMVTDQQAQAAMRRGLDLNPSDYFSRRRESYFFDYVKDELIKEYGARTVKLGGLVVHTTIDLDKQRKAREAIATQLGDAGPSSALVTISPRNGYILAMASSGDYADSKFNLAAQGERQPGSSFKTMALMTALRNGVNPNSTRYTSVSPTRINDPRFGAPFEIKTYGGTSGGNMNLFQATLRSDNSVFIQLALDLGPENVADTAVDMGIKREHVHGYPAESLGGLEEGVSPLEMATAYGTIASGGYRNRPTAITKVEFPNGKSELPRRWRVKRTKVFTDGQTYEATKILEANIQGGTGGRAATGCPAAGKTGTTDRNTDAWFAGFTPRYATAVWVGYPNDRTEMHTLFFGGPVDGGTFPAAIWGAYTKSIIGGFCGSFPQPKEAFVTQPFSGDYSSSGGNKLGFSEEPDEPVTGEPEEEEPTPTEDDAPSGGTEFDPEQYESAPQEEPATEAPPADGTIP
jgi:penicillin-binding protein 1A